MKKISSQQKAKRIFQQFCCLHDFSDSIKHSRTSNYLVWPHPLATTEVPPPVKAEAREAGATLPVVATPVEVSSKEMSLARVAELYDGWFTILEVPCVVPPDVREMAPTTTIAKTRK